MKKFLWIIPIATSIGVYSVALNNFFVCDDFIWLYRAKTLGQNWHQMFYPDIIYFDPIVYLMFFADYHIAYLDPRWYHAVDIIIHAVNAVLVYRFASMVSGDEKASLYGSVLFASSFAIADAVLWPSSRVDLVSVTFSLGVLIQFLKYIHTDNSRNYWLSWLLFIFALGAKGTPVVLPFFLFWLIIAEEKPIRRIVSVIPFGLLVVLYFALLKIALLQTGKPVPELHFNLRNLYLALSEFFFQEHQTATMNPVVTGTALILLIIVFGFYKFPSESTTRLRRAGTVIFAGALMPVLVLKDFKLLTDLNDPTNLLLSPSHRIYFASIGLAIIGGGVLRSLELFIKHYYPKAATLLITIFLVFIIGYNAIKVRERDQIWESVGVKVRCGLNGLLVHREKIKEDGLIGLVGFPGSQGFINPMIMVYFNLNKITTKQLLAMGQITEPEILKKADNSSFFVQGDSYQVYDLSDQFKATLSACERGYLNPSISEYMMECDTSAKYMNWKIQETLEEDYVFNKHD